MLLGALWLFLLASSGMAAWFGGEEGGLSPEQAIRLQLPIWLVTSLPLFLAAARRREWAAFLGLGPGRHGFAAGLAAGGGFLVLGLLLWVPLGQVWFTLLGKLGVAVEPQPHYRHLAEAIAAGRPDPLLLLLVVLVHPFFEELLFRGLLQGWVRRWLPRGWALAVAALVFGLVHPPWPFFLPLFLLGLLFGYIREWSGSIWSAWTAHALFNGVMIALSPWMLEAYEAF
jgi:membrane protease YdiL (CAAX protease family)